MSDAWVNHGKSRTRLLIRVNGSNPTFKIDVERIERSALAELDDLMADLIDIASVVFAADSAVRRGGATRPSFGSDWDRRFEFRIPVRKPQRWQTGQVRELLEETVGFLTGDTVSFVFMQRDGPDDRQTFMNFDPTTDAFRAEEVILFSGGLDSFSGALHALSTGTGNVILLTHISAQKAIPRQEHLGKVITEMFPGRVLHIRVRATNKGHGGKETTQRSRSLLFAALGQAVARAFGAERVSFHENGVISHNLPINEAVVGTMATRTTHPLSLTLLNRLMEAIDPAGAVPILNPFEWLTKAEVIGKGLDHGGKPHIRHTVSCTSVREQDTLHTHCGSCSQCLDRRFAILSLAIEDADPADMYKVDVVSGARDSEHSRTMAIDWTRHAIALRDKTQLQFGHDFAGSIAKLVRGHPGMPSSQVVASIHEMHRRHGEAVFRAMSRMAREYSGALVAGTLPSSSLLVMHIGSSGELRNDPRNYQRPVRRDSGIPVDKRDLVPDRAGVLEVSFLEERGRSVVRVLGIGEIRDRPAQVAHALKPGFDEDREAGLPRAEYRFTSSGELARRLTLSKETISQHVRRCRKVLGEYYAEIHGSPPSRPLLIESRRPAGYRLDPDIRIVTQQKTANI